MKVFAQQLENPVIDKALRNESGINFFNRVVPFFFQWLIVIGVGFFVVQFLLGGFKWINSQGKSDKVEEAQKQLTNALIGILILFSVFAIVKIIGIAFGLNNLQNLKIVLPKL